MASFDYLPEDLVVEIMSWLPPESLLQIKFINKWFHHLFTTLIKEPPFVVKHLHNSNKNLSSSTSLFFRSIHGLTRTGVTHTEVYIKGFLTIYQDHSDKEINFDIGRCSPLLDEISDQISFVELGSHCDGITCIADDSFGRFLLCNPAIGEFTRLPRHSSLYYQLWTVMFGFGYDSIGNVYKIVKVGIDPYLSYDPSYKAEVYTLGTESWKLIKIEIETGVSHGKGVYCKGVSYWLVWNPSDKEIIISFDFHSEEFRRMPLPSNLSARHEEENVHSRKLAVWKDSLALFSYAKEEIMPLKSIELWVMSSSCGWTKMLTIDSGMDFPLEFWNNDEELLMVTDDDRKSLVSYNLQSKNVRNLDFNGIDFFCGVHYVKSLVSISHKNYRPH
ncbi:hypothetical protein UlMin_029151 [Ulmus minor]